MPKGTLPWYNMGDGEGGWTCGCMSNSLKANGVEENRERNRLEVGRPRKWGLLNPNGGNQ